MQLSNDFESPIMQSLNDFELHAIIEWFWMTYY